MEIGTFIKKDKKKLPKKIITLAVYRSPLNLIKTFIIRIGI